MRKNVVKVATGLGAASVLAVSGAAIASSQVAPSAHTAQSSVTQHAPRGGHLHGAPVTGATLANVKAAIKAKDAAITVKAVFSERDGSYHAMGTQAGKPVHIHVSKDLKTVTVKTGGFRGAGGHGDHRGHLRGTPVTGATLTNVKTAIKAKDSAVTVERVVQGADGSYHAMGMKAGKPVHIHVSKDLKTVTVKTGGHGGHGGPGHGDFRGGHHAHAGQPGQPGQRGQVPSNAPAASAAA